MKLLFVLLFVSTTFFSRSQYIEEREDLSSKRRPGVMWFYSGFRPYEKEKLRKYDRLIIDVVYNDWQGDRELFESPWYSIGLNTSLMFDIPFTKANTIGLGWGFGFSHYNNHTKTNFNRNFEENTTTLSNLDNTLDIKRSKYAANYLEIPLELRFRTKGIKHFKLLIGGKIGYQLNAYTKTVEEINDRDYKFKSFNFPDNNRLRYGATVRVGYRNFSLYGAYFFSSLFNDEQSVLLTPVNIGVSIALF
ncbi:MAG: outer membrane beta-barrel protein [Lishizhenia sp.]